MSAVSIKFLNLLEEAKYAFLAGDFHKAEELLAEARTMAVFERRLADEGMAG